MGLLQNKSWMTEELYNQYLQLKTEIPQLIKARDFYVSKQSDLGILDYQNSIDEKVERLKYILNQLKVVHGIAMEDLILLSIGIDV
ncbi:hypothetical protein [Oceanobacillus profundus]|uniref:Uncharacterized protein n=1 Tax=Oceanobacillus profundus TaxID=372463 RepID=A0A417YGF4_9BACI|nr:hypothetical protein [Oceanobacillus profundus]RHW31869.1 hypothetical protein D1B32_11565 [Oceanobacillus profundus]